MDGTLLNSDEEISDYTQDVIRQALDKNIHIVLSTGRWLKTCYPYAEQLNLNSYLVTANGGEIWTMDLELLDRHLLPAEKVERMWHIGKGVGVHMWMMATDRVFRNTPPESFYYYDWLKFGCNSLEQKKLDQMIEELSYIDGLELTNSMPTNVEANPEGVNKAAALEKVCREIGITMDEVMAVGDSLNDMKMIQEAGIGVAMGNAQEAILKAADVTTDTNDRDGVALAIERYVL
jgi:hypothetical protein